jgi:hypothetical protein
MNDKGTPRPDYWNDTTVFEDSANNKNQYSPRYTVEFE